MVDHINNAEEGYSVREKLNTVIDRTNDLQGIEGQVEANKNLSQQNKAAIEKEVQDRIDADAALQAEIDKKADGDHTHEIADIDQLQEILDNKQEAGNYVTEAPDDGYQYARQFLVDDPDGDGLMTWTIVRAGGGGTGGGAGMVIRATPPDPDDRVVGMQWLNELNGEVWIWDGTRWLEFPAEGGLHKGGGGGIPFPDEELRTGQWLAYRQIDDVYDPVDGTLVSEGVYEWGILTTDMVSTNPLLDDPDSTATLKLLQRWGADLAGLDNQLKVNRFIYDKLVEVEERAVNFGFIEVPNGEKTLRHDPNLLNHGGGVAAGDCLILHVAIDETTTSPNQKLVFVCPEGQEVIDHFEATQQEAIFKVVQLDESNGGALSMTMRGINGGVMSGDVYTIECDQVYGDDLADGKPCQILVRTSSAITAEWVENNFVHRKGGDSMEGPLTILPQDVTDARATKRINTYGVYSGSASSALRLGTTTDRVYIGSNDVSINGPIKVSVVEEKNSGDGIYIADTLKFTGDTRDIMNIIPSDGATHTVDMFRTGLANGSNLDLKLWGSTYKNKLRIYGRSNAASLVAQIASDGSFNLYTPLDMNGEKISELADPVSPQDAVNQRTLTAAIDAIPDVDLTGYATEQYVDDAIDAIPAPPAADLTPIQDDIDNLEGRVSILEQTLLTQGEYTRQAETYPDGAGEFTTLSSGGSPNAMVANIRTIWVADREAGGNDVNLAGFNGTKIQFLDEDGERYTFTVSGTNSGTPNAEGITYFSFSVSGGFHTGGETVMAVGEKLFLELPGLARSVTTASLPLEHPQDPPPTREIVVDGWETQSDANQTFLVADYAQQQEILALDERVVALEGAGGSGVGGPESHTMLGKGSWGNSKDQLSTNQFYGIDYSDRGRGVLDQYTYGLVFAQRFADKVTSNYTFQAGAWVEVYNNNGELIFSQEIDSMEVVNGYLYLRWEYAPQIYRYSYTPSYGTSMFVKLHGVGDPTHQTGAFAAPEKLAPPEGDPFIEQ